MRAPSRSAPARFAGVTVVGITTTAGTPNIFAAIATACAWLPDDGATTPRSRSAVAQLRQEVVRAAKLERAATLQHLRLHPDLRTQQLRCVIERQERRAHRDRRDPLGRGRQILQVISSVLDESRRQANTRFRPPLLAL